MIVVIVRLGPAEIAAQLLAVGPGIVWILMIHAVSIAIAALPWYLLLPPPARPTVPQAIASRFVSAGANAVLPLLGIGGDFARLWWLRRGDRAAGVAAIVADRLIYGASNILMLLVGIIALVSASSLPRDYTFAAAGGMAVLLVLVGVGMLVARRYRLAGRIHRRIQRMRRRVEDSQFGDEIDQHIEQMLRRESRVAWLSWLLHFIAKLTLGVEIYVGFALLGVQLGWDQALVFAALPVILAFAGIVVPSQLGVQEGAFAVVATSFGISASTAVAVVLLLRARQLVGGIIIVIILAMRRIQRPAEPA